MSNARSRGFGRASHSELIHIELSDNNQTLVIKAIDYGCIVCRYKVPNYSVSSSCPVTPSGAANTGGQHEPVLNTISQW